jgi:hypothetical protein
MTISSKLGVASLFLLAGSVLTSGLELPISFAAAVITLVLGLFAAQSGSKWWLAVPFSVVAMLGLFFVVGWQAS